MRAEGEGKTLLSLYHEVRGEGEAFKFKTKKKKKNTTSMSERDQREYDDNKGERIISDKTSASVLSWVVVSKFSGMTEKLPRNLKF